MNSRRSRFHRMVAVTGLSLISVGCRTFDWWSELQSDHRTSIQDRDTDAALHINSKGLRYANHGKMGKAESAFHRAIARDPKSAAAHNNLGNLYLSRHELYQAAWEFERASQLSPQSVEPHINLGVVHEVANRLEEAATFYTQALSIAPNHPIALGNLARVRVQQNMDPMALAPLLRHLAFVDSRPEWIEWAEHLLNAQYQIYDDSFPVEIPYQEEPLGLPMQMPLEVPSSEYRETLPKPSVEPTQTSSIEGTLPFYGYQPSLIQDFGLPVDTQSQFQTFSTSTVPLPFVSNSAGSDGVVKPVFELGGQP